MKVQSGRVFVGGAGVVTEVLAEFEPSDRPDVRGTLAMWFLQCPGQSAAWQHYGLSVIHLRPIDGVRPAHISRPGATHEIMLYALDPNLDPNPVDPRSWQHLTPVNFVGQLKLPSDESAKETLYHLARAVADGMLWAEPPLSGQQEPWARQLRLLEEHSLPIVVMFFVQSYLHLQRIKAISKNYDMRIAEMRSLQNSMRNRIANLQGSVDALSLDVASLVAREIELRRAEEQPVPRVVRRPIRLS